MLKKFKRYPLTFGPTHIEKLERLSKHLGGKVELYAKREDAIAPNAALPSIVSSTPETRCAGQWHSDSTSKRRPYVQLGRLPSGNGLTELTADAIEI